MKCGLVAYGSKESEGVSQTDMAKRAQVVYYVDSTDSTDCW